MYAPGALLRVSAAAVLALVTLAADVSGGVFVEAGFVLAGALAAGRAGEGGHRSGRKVSVHD